MFRVNKKEKAGSIETEIWSGNYNQDFAFSTDFIMVVYTSEMFVFIM
jgi:hypothetical protein